MPRVILAFLSKPQCANALLGAALCAAELCQAGRINALAVRLPPADTIMPSEEVLTREHEADVRGRESRRVELLKAEFDRWTAMLPTTAPQIGWFDIEARVAAALVEYGSRSDVIVLPRPSEHAAEVEHQALHAALFHAGRPVLAIPPEKPYVPFGRHVAFAWRDDPRTAKAVLTALHLIGQPERIDVIAGIREGAPTPRLPQIFEEHAAPAKLWPMLLPHKGAFGAALLDKVHSLGADMLAMGAFAHNPLHTLILGGVTRHMLAYADLPLLMRH